MVGGGRHEHVSIIWLRRALKAYPGLRRRLWRLRPPVLALGGGGARGFAHLGVLEVLEDAGLGVRAIAGTSMGAVIGAMYLAHGSAAAVIDRWQEARRRGLMPTVLTPGSVANGEPGEHPLVQVARRIRSRIVISFAINRPTMLDGGDLSRALEFLLPDMAIEELSKPLCVVTTDLETGAEILLDRGPLRPAVQASSAIPGLLPATSIDGRFLVDGGVVAEVPVAAARSLGRPVIAVDVSMGLPPLSADDLVLDTMMRTQSMTARLLRQAHLRRADDVVRPEVGSVTWAEWDAFDRLVECGREAARHWLGLPEPAPPPAASPKAIVITDH